jgi:hypothetical protein
MNAAPAFASKLAMFQLLVSSRWIHHWQRQQKRADPGRRRGKKNAADFINAFSPRTSRCGI